MWSIRFSPAGSVPAGTVVASSLVVIAAPAFEEWIVQAAAADGAGATHGVGQLVVGPF